jgi:hypothetical protein
VERRGVRGYVGPLGDDIPSIFPIVTGILLLATTMFYVSNAMATKQSYFDLRKSALGISYTMLDKGLLGWSVQEANSNFLEKCAAARAQAKIRGTDYAISIKRFCGPLNLSFTNIVELFDPEVPSEPTPVGRISIPGFFCSSMEGDWSDVAEKAVNETYVILNYPIAVPCGEVFGSSANVERGIGLLSIIVWKKL